MKTKLEETGIPPTVIQSYKEEGNTIVTTFHIQGASRAYEISCRKSEPFLLTIIFVKLRRSLLLSPSSCFTASHSIPLSTSTTPSMFFFL